MTSLNTDIKKQVVSATKWSAITEFAAKLVAPISTILLARILTPDAFGVLVTVTMVISFGEIFADAGFQKYIVQHQFKDQKSLYQSTNVAFIANLICSLSVWLVLLMFSKPLAILLGNENCSTSIVAAGICIPLAAISSLHIALFKRFFDFKTLFFVRIIGTLIPLIITVPLALLLKNYWALVIGMMALYISNAVILTIKSSWKPKLRFNWSLFKEMFSFTIWSLIESILIWLTSYIDIFFIGKLLNDYYLGLYRTSINTVGQIMSLITAATVPVLFSSLSRLQDDNNEFKEMFLKFQRIVAILLIPIGMTLFVFRDFITITLLGKEWMEASFFIGMWGITGSVTIVLAQFCSEVYRAKGKPKISAAIQISQILTIVPIVLWAIPHGYDYLCEWRSLARFESIVANLIVMYIIVHISPMTMLENMLPPMLGGVIMFIFIYIWPISNSYSIQIVQILICNIIYFAFLFLFKKDRKVILNLKSILKI